MSSSSILHTVEVPGFDPVTGQLSLDSHHLVSAPLGYSTSFSPRCTLLFDTPTRKAHDTAQETTTDGRPRKKRKKSGKLGQDATPADWLLERENRDKHKTTTDRESEEHHASVVLHLEGAIDAVRQSWMSLNSDEKVVDWIGQLDSRSKWTTRERTDLVEADLAGLADANTSEAKSVANPETRHNLDANSALTLRSLVDRVEVNRSDDELMVPLFEDDGTTPSPFRLVVPPWSGFCLSTFGEAWSERERGIHTLGQEVGGWDILIMDPPWPNASATRSSSYETFDPYDLWKLDVRELLGRSKPVLVAIWLTNRVKYRRLLLEKLFPAWKIENPVEWYWVKIASETGEPVWSLESSHRRCYEGLVLGWYNPTNETLPPLPDRKVFLSTTIGHSRKPILFDLLLPLLPLSDSPPNIIELFARTTLAGPRLLPSKAEEGNRGKDEEEEGGEGKRGFFLAVGNEAIKFNLSVGPDKRGGCKGWIELDEELENGLGAGARRGRADPDERGADEIE